MLLVNGVDLGEDLLVLGEAVGRLIGVNARPVDVHLEDPARALDERRGDAVPVLDGGLQTGGLGKVVSLAAVLDPNVHRASPLSRKMYRGSILSSPLAMLRRKAAIL